ncbi:hypothetical protein D0T49_02010 [Paludibacter sp. 221]|uniref:hypothetical protein n=1 Tax=Paludibacter sp. 221 TaxID=2302939 RepID=UPI0013D84D7B|nr:hypothetical protein [Paludibacter sp. 221]NDV45825.1 hypothetical protein [Paludibacter sp. 221]
MKHFKQEQPYGCGLYALANAFQDNWPITEHNLRREVNGGNVGKLNQYLLEREEGCYIAYLRYNNGEPVEMIDFSSTDLSKESYNNCWYPFFIVVPSTKEKNHIICCRYMKDNSIIVHDSLKNEPDIFQSFSEFENSYPKVLSIEALFMLNNSMPAILFENE